MNKKLSFLLVFLLFYQTIASSLVFSAENDAEELEQSIVTAVTITDDEGNVLNIADIPTASPENIQVDWSVKDIDVTEGTTESFTIPSGLYLEKEQTGSLTYEEIEVGTFQASIDGNVELIFYKEVEEHANANGTFLLKASAVTESDQPEEPSEPEDKEPVENEEKPLDKKNRSASEEQEEETTQPKKDQTVQSSFTKTEIKENLITDFELTLRDGSPLPDPLPHPSEELELKVHYDFALPNDHEYAAGSTFTFQLPEQLTVYNMVTGELGGDYGQYEVTTDGTVTFTFNKNIELKSDITGYLEVYSVIDKYLEGGTEQTIKVPIREDEVKEIDLHFESK
ncbi:Ig-like domain-containing protein [Gracilibacillus sp. JCM 18860]|uniref:Ig-like domain-containing protein n=1 Tax=Gracilibacillus sp. JCM 18860 TaxID=1306159 RepID=UPI0006D0056F